MDTNFTTPETAPAPHSGTRARLRRLRFWLRCLLLWEERPTAAAYADLRDKLLTAQQEVLRLQCDLAVVSAQRDAALQHVETLALVCARNQERVRAEMSAASADRERAVASAAVTRTGRLNGDG